MHSYLLTHLMQLTENRKEVCDSASAKFQSEEAGNVDFVGTEAGNNRRN